MGATLCKSFNTSSLNSLLYFIVVFPFWFVIILPDFWVFVDCFFSITLHRYCNCLLVLLFMMCSYSLLSRICLRNILYLYLLCHFSVYKVNIILYRLMIIIDPFRNISAFDKHKIVNINELPDEFIILVAFKVFRRKTFVCQLFQNMSLLVFQIQ